MLKLDSMVLCPAEWALICFVKLGALGYLNWFLIIKFGA